MWWMPWWPLPPKLPLQRFALYASTVDEELEESERHKWCRDIVVGVSPHREMRVGVNLDISEGESSLEDEEHTGNEVKG